MSIICENILSHTLMSCVLYIYIMLQQKAFKIHAYLKITYPKVKLECVGELPPNLPSTYSSLTAGEEGEGATATIAWEAPSPVSALP